MTIDEAYKTCFCEPYIVPVEKHKEARAIIDKALEEVQQYREIGTVEELKQLKENGAFTGRELAQIAAMQMTLKKYREIGTPEECREAVEKMKR